MVFKSHKTKEDFRGIAVLVPMHNEEKGAKKCIDDVIKTIKRLKIRSSLIVVNDGSTDGTSEILNNLKTKYKRILILVEYRKNKGYGTALVFGINEAYKQKFRYVAIFDSDLTNNTRHIKLFERKYHEDWDFIKGSRFIDGGGMLDVPLRRKIFTYTGNFIARNLFRMGIKDCTNGLRMVKTKYLYKIPYKEKGFPIIMEELYHLKKMGAKGTEIPNILTSRKGSSSSFRYNFKLLRSYFLYAWKAYFLP